MSRKKIKNNKRTDCGFCNKDIKKNMSYYRDEKYFCHKTHWARLKKEGAKDGKNKN